VITKLDRLFRSTRELLNIIHRLESKNVSRKVLDQSIDTGSATGRLMVSVIGSIAQFENDLRKERQSDGIAMAKSRGVQLDRHFKLNNEQIAEMK
jgi:DNA invertase Pin-like site-specific DNA recombinase